MALRSAISSASADLPDAQKSVVLELYTSQSCSSCPPADRLLEKLAKNRNVIALGCHVTYWDHLSWRDTLSIPVCTERQRNYNAFLDRGVFTPQLIVNGKVSMVGSNALAVGSAMVGASDLSLVGVTVQGARVDVALPQMSSGNYFVTVFAKKSHHTQSIPSGENSGETVGYTDPVVDIVTLGPWDGTGKAMVANIDVPFERAAVLVQDAETWHVIAAGQN